MEPPFDIMKHMDDIYDLEKNIGMKGRYPSTRISAYLHFVERGVKKKLADIHVQVKTD